MVWQWSRSATTTRSPHVSRLISHHMWCVSAVHEQSGRSVEVWGDLLGSTAVRGGGDLSSYRRLLPSVPQRLSLIMIQALVHRPGAKLLQPDATAFARFLLDGCDTSFVDKFNSDLRALSEEIKTWNATSPDPLVMLDPDQLEVAVTV